LIDFAFGNLDLVVHVSFTKTLSKQLAADLALEARNGNTVGCQFLFELRNGEAVIGRNLFDRAVEHVVVDTNAGIAGFLLDDSFKNHAIKRLVAKVVHRGQRNVSSAKIRSHLMNSLLQLDLRNHIVIHHGCDTIDRDGCVFMSRSRFFLCRCFLCVRIVCIDRAEGEEGAGTYCIKMSQFHSLFVVIISADFNRLRPDRLVTGNAFA